jgi:hypothetical protein
MIIKEIMSIRIASLQNSKIKFAVSLHKASVRKKEGLFLIEGIREIRLAMLAGYQFHSLFVCPSIIANASTGVSGDNPEIYSGAKDVIDILTG